MRNLSFYCTEEDLFRLLQAFGEIKEVHLPVDDFGKFKGFAFAEFLEAESSQKARLELDGTIFQGKLCSFFELSVRRYIFDQV